jgi:ATP-dependent DNA helicase RecG
LFGAAEIRSGGGVASAHQSAIHEILEEEDRATIHTGRIVPVYEKAGSVTPKIPAQAVYDALQRLPSDLPDTLPDALRMRLGLPRAAAFLAAHFPRPTICRSSAEPLRTPRSAC